MKFLLLLFVVVAFGLDENRLLRRDLGGGGCGKKDRGECALAEHCKWKVNKNKCRKIDEGRRVLEEEELMIDEECDEEDEDCRSRRALAGCKHKDEGECALAFDHCKWKASKNKCKKIDTGRRELGGRS